MKSLVFDNQCCEKAMVSWKQQITREMCLKQCSQFRWHQISFYELNAINKRHMIVSLFNGCYHNFVGWHCPILKHFTHVTICCVKWIYFWQVSLPKIVHQNWMYSLDNACIFWQPFPLKLYRRQSTSEQSSEIAVGQDTVCMKRHRW